MLGLDGFSEFILCKCIDMRDFFGFVLPLDRSSVLMVVRSSSLEGTESLADFCGVMKSLEAGEAD